MTFGADQMSFYPQLWACPLINKTEKQVLLSEVIVDNCVGFVHVWGNKSVNYTGMDINVVSLKQRNTD